MDFTRSSRMNICIFKEGKGHCSPLSHPQYSLNTQSCIKRILVVPNSAFWAVWAARAARAARAGIENSPILLSYFRGWFFVQIVMEKTDSKLNFI